MKKIALSFLIGINLISSFCFGGETHDSNARFNLPNRFVSQRWVEERARQLGYPLSPFYEIFQVLEKPRMLEWSAGFSTKYFLDMCSHVTSIELIPNSRSLNLFQYFFYLYRDAYASWQPLACCPENLKERCEAFSPTLELSSVFSALENSNKEDFSYLKDLDALIHNLLSKQSIDISLVDSQLNLRGDIIQLLFNRVPIIVAYDTRPAKNNPYQYESVRTPDNYEKIVIEKGKGMTFWIEQSPDMEKVIKRLKDYVSAL
jgi:hypothetical protein